MHTLSICAVCLLFSFICLAAICITVVCVTNTVCHYFSGERKSTSSMTRIMSTNFPKAKTDGRTKTMTRQRK
ncbi:hypothetical protein BGZ61DRAFT_443303 [Ilyonectria robusta]|uniref:uncharacterized protein n=1 Tax=Ilyonectria robusta TaxID=1079257 RepID=UPI001E8D29CB|nr:uncharacterized protein BGZ61DRAFT_443303 [Ilyonectria robusta]KAH8734883.1 hypothetical protein BGZ61DRAFT_443303 [Ilyonectria robusta]